MHAVHKGGRDRPCVMQEAAHSKSERKQDRSDPELPTGADDRHAVGMLALRGRAWLPEWWDEKRVVPLFLPGHATFDHVVWVCKSCPSDSE